MPTKSNTEIELIDSAGQAKLTGLSFSKLSTAELEPLIENDPAVKAGLESFRLLTHVFPKGSLDFNGSRRGRS